MIDGGPSDSVQVYLTQMSNTPLLNRGQELQAARHIEAARKTLRHAMLATDYVLRGAVAMLDKVAAGRMRPEVAFEGAMSVDEYKRRLMASVGPNVRTLKHLVRCNRADFSVVMSKASPPERRRQVRRRLLMRRAKAVRLVEETLVRRQHLDLLVEKLKEIARRMDMRSQEIGEARHEHDDARAAFARKELRRLMRMTQRNAGAAAAAPVTHCRPAPHSRQRPTRAVHGQLAAGGLHRQALSQPRPQLP